MDKTPSLPQDISITGAGEQAASLGRGNLSLGRKARKPYTISKTRENWSEEEHQKFLEALKLYDRDWKRIEKFIGTKTVIQIRSHAQKYFQKVQKSGSGERIPPPRPKRKSSQPYPTKAKTGSSPRVAFLTSLKDSVSVPWLVTPENAQLNPLINSPTSFGQWMASNGLLPTSLASNFNAAQAVELQKQQQEQLLQAQQYLKQAMTTAQENMKNTTHGPNYAKIYAFLGNLFDNKDSNHSKAFNALDPIDRETIQLMLQNLATNVSGQPEFKESHAYLVEQYKTISGVNLPNVAPVQVVDTQSIQTPTDVLSLQDMAK